MGKGSGLVADCGCANSGGAGVGGAALAWRGCGRSPPANSKTPSNEAMESVRIKTESPRERQAGKQEGWVKITARRGWSGRVFRLNVGTDGGLCGPERLERLLWGTAHNATRSELCGNAACLGGAQRASCQCGVCV